ncbi:LppP/LprE family lipoprotein [Microcoleus sp. ARI1-B5]|uniref:LppP/LprE family lipoprotein n=1 Tax=unclassified Microcoleus TaxID=2642155 RepID=UPI002FD109A4
MKIQTLYPISLALALAPLAVATTVLGQQSSSSWLERNPPINWNKPGASIPKAPDNNFSNAARCQQQIRNPSTPEERAVKAAGWTLSNGRGETKNSGGVLLVKGQTGFDGMCRPLGYQEFVFVSGIFAGTTSPYPMNARTDGALFQTDIETSSRLKARFFRYTRQDALCCPSRTSEVTYRIDATNSTPLVLPIQVRTYANSQ